MVLHEDRSVLEHCQHLFMTWLAEIGLTLNVAKTHIRHTLEGDQPGMDVLGFHIRQYRRVDHLTWVKLRHWARRRHPHASAGWVYDRYWPRRHSRRVFAMPVTPQGQAYPTSHREIPSLWHAKVAGHRSSDDGDWLYWSIRRGRDPTVGPRLATLLKRQSGRCVYGGLFFQHDDQLEVDHISGHRQDSRYNNLQALHGHCHDAKTREQGEYLPVGMRNKHQDAEERSARKRARSVLEQR